MAKTIIHDGSGNAKWGDEDHLSVAQNRNFASLVFEMLCEKAPTEQELKVFELILNLSIDHGPDTPSAVAVIGAAKEGKTISEAVAAGILKIDDVHGGAQEQLMELLLSIKGQVLSIKGLVADYLKQDKRIPGYGHRLYKESDPRAQLILNSLRENGFGDEFVKMAQELESELEKQKGTKLPLNIDGAIAVALCTIGWQPRLGKAVFLVARTPGLCAHYLNNSSNE